MRHLWKKWLALLVFVAVLGTTFVMLGNWQLDRLEQRRTNNARVIAAEEAPVRPYSEVMGGPIAEEDQWRRVEVTGRYEPQQFVVRYRNYDGQPGIEIVTPLRTTEGDLLLVDRGFWPRGPRELTAAEVPPPPSGEVTVVGHVRRNERGPDRATVPDAEGRLRLISSPQISRTLGTDALDGYVTLVESKPAQDEVLQPVPLPELSDGPHFWYAVQWFLFCGIAVVGVVIFIRSDLMGKKKSGSDPGDDEDDRRPASASGDASTTGADEAELTTR
ncbi:SURF1 family cytochrome oxidase biogenesis protein [Enemella sp. A6]|uniref:SURF1 family cytochrome oxidase biogenesis protein n=1 Tax=Enemella sp. A6 TaxID=3440152 RepID=UPI003EBD43CF